MSQVGLEYRGRVAILTLNNPKKLNAMSEDTMDEIIEKLNDIEKHDEVTITVFLATGRYFSAGGNTSTFSADTNECKYWLHNILVSILALIRAFYTHTKVLVVGLNGPVIGLPATLIAHADFIYCTPHTYLYLPFSRVGVLAEGAATCAIVERLGSARANEALFMAKPIQAPELERCGFVNAIFEVGENEGGKFRDLVMQEVDKWLCKDRHHDSMLGLKKLMVEKRSTVTEAQNMREFFALVERFGTGIPQKQFKKMRAGKNAHKL